MQISQGENHEKSETSAPTKEHQPVVQYVSSLQNQIKTLNIILIGIRVPEMKTHTHIYTYIYTYKP